MKIGDLVKNKYNNKVGIIISHSGRPHRILGVMYSVYIDGLDVLLHESDLEVLW